MKNKKKILYIVEAMGGGVFTYVVDMTNELIKEFDVFVAYAVRPQTPQNYREYFDNRVQLIEVENFCREINPVKDIEALCEIKKIANNIKPDIIHLHSSKAGVIGRMAFAFEKIPLFYTPHGYSFLMKDTSRLKRTVYWLIEKTFSLVDCMTISCSYGEYLETLKLTRNATYVNNGINVSDLNEKLLDVKETEHEFTVFTIGRICYQKNPKLFNEIAKALPKIKFLWIGDGEDRDKLDSENIEITGWLKRDEALAKSANADVFILTSLWEGLPISLLEAMYMKKPCIVSDVIGNHDVIKHQINGYVCNSISDYVTAIEEAKKKLYVEQAYLDLLENYNTKVQAEGYAQIYRKFTGE